MKTILLGVPVIAATLAVHASPAPPMMLFQGTYVAEPGSASKVRKAYAIMRLPGGRFAFFDRYRPQVGPLTLPDVKGRLHALLPHLPPAIVGSEVIAGSRILVRPQVILTPDDEVVSVYVKGEKLLSRDAAKKAGLRRYLNVWVERASVTAAVEPKMIWRGYNGSQMEYEQLPNGRLIVPYGSLQPHTQPLPPTGRHKVIIQYSDDGGRSWTESKPKLVAPCYTGFNGINEGACEPAIELLKDGRIWMLMRTQTGFLYESYSNDNGTTWQDARASRFNTSTSPPNIMRHKNGWLVVSWNNCEMPPRHEGQGVYGGRDALHIAVSNDEGLTWRGFREVYLDHRRHGNPAKAGDRGTAYPLGAYTSDGRIVILAGQGKGGRNPIVIDPEWIIETEAETDFSDGLKQWSVHKQHGPAKRWWRARAVGCELVPSPTDPNARSLHVRKADGLPADGAVWNFPNGWKGSLSARVMIREGYQGGSIALNDRFFDPVNDRGEDLAVFKVALGPDGRVGGSVLQPGRWYDLTLTWGLAAPECQLLVDGANVGATELRHRTLNGISYVRFRSAATELDTAGFLVDRVKVVIDDPHAPPCSPRDQLEHEKRYVASEVPRWSKDH